MPPITNYIKFEPAPSETVVLVAERLEDSATDMRATTQGWLRSNSSYVEQLSAVSPTTAIVNDGTYPRLRSLGAEPFQDLSLDIKFTSSASMNTWVAAQDLSSLRARLTITEGGSVIAQATSQPYDTNSTGSTTGGNNAQVRMKLDVVDFTTGVAPKEGTDVDNWVGKPQGWTLSSGVLIELFYP